MVDALARLRAGILASAGGMVNRDPSSDAQVSDRKEVPAPTLLAPGFGGAGSSSLAGCRGSDGALAGNGNGNGSRDGPMGSSRLCLS
jgi:hypothetical protein